MRELLVEVGGASGELAAVEVLVEAGVKGSGAGVDGGGRQGELFGERGLTGAGGGGEVEAGAAEAPGSGTDGSVGEPEARRADQAEQAGVLDAAGGLDEKAVADLGSERGGGEEMDALCTLRAGGEQVGAALAVISGSERAVQEAGEGVVGLVGKLVAVGDEVLAGWTLEEGGDSGGGVAVGAGDGDR